MSDTELDFRARVEACQSQVRASYHDDSYPERNCDYCQRPYRGPAVYCRLECALADA